jgi:hypothetical protein
MVDDAGLASANSVRVCTLLLQGQVRLRCVYDLGTDAAESVHDVVSAAVHGLPDEHSWAAPTQSAGAPMVGNASSDVAPASSNSDTVIAVGAAPAPATCTASSAPLLQFAVTPTGSGGLDVSGSAAICEAPPYSSRESTGSTGTPAAAASVSICDNPLGGENSQQQEVEMVTVRPHVRVTGDALAGSATEGSATCTVSASTQQRPPASAADVLDALDAAVAQARAVSRQERLREPATPAPSPQRTGMCGVVIAEDDLLRALEGDDAMVSKYRRFKALASDRNMRECPYRDCGGMQAGTASSPTMRCPRCGREFCFLHANAHVGSSCEAYEAEHAAELQANEPILQAETKPCPTWCVAQPPTCNARSLWTGWPGRQEEGVSPI